MEPMMLLNPGPANTTAAVKQAMTKPDICPREQSFGQTLGRVRDGVTRVVHDGDTYTSVLFGGSGTAAVEAAVASAVPEHGRLLVVDNGSYGARIADIAAAYGIEHDVLAFGVGGVVDVERVQQALSEKRYTQLAIIHHETSTGILNPVSEVGAVCRAQGVEMIVDAMSSYAGIPIDIEAMGADFLVSSSNKCIQGMAGLGFVICKRARVADMAPVRGRSLYLDLGAQHRFFEQHGQMRFTPPVQVVYALEQALLEYFEEGAEGRHRRYVDNWKVLDAGMLALGFKRLLPEQVLSRILTSYIEPDHPQYSFDALHDGLFSRGFTIYPGKGAAKATFRLANMGDMTRQDMTRFLDALQGVVDQMGIQPLYSR